MSRQKLIGGNTSQRLETVTFQSVFMQLRLDAGIETNPGLIADIYRVRNRRDPSMASIELVWEQGRRTTSVEGALRDLVPKAVIGYAEAIDTSLVIREAFMGDLAVCSEILSGREIAATLACRELVLRCVLSDQAIG